MVALATKTTPATEVVEIRTAMGALVVTKMMILVISLEGMEDRVVDSMFVFLSRLESIHL